MHDERRRIEDRVRARPHRSASSPPPTRPPCPSRSRRGRRRTNRCRSPRRAAAPYEPFAIGTPWGPPWGTTWFRVHGEVPAEWAGRRVEAVFDLGFVGDWPGNQAEALVHTAGRRAAQGASTRRTSTCRSPTRPTGGEQVDAASSRPPPTPTSSPTTSPPTPLGDKLTAGDEPLYTLRPRRPRRPRRGRLAPRPRPRGAARADAGAGRARRRAATRSCAPWTARWTRLDLDDVAGTAAAARERAAPTSWRAPAHASAHTSPRVGHAHIDSAWLWPLRETKRKTSRTFSNVTALAEEYPEFVFACSQAQQYAWVQGQLPAGLGADQEGRADGQWAPVGGMWVEADGNLPGGEALARQLVHGKRFFLDEFGIETKEVWLPDSFGYTAALPAARQAGRRRSGS